MKTLFIFLLLILSTLSQGQDSTSVSVKAPIQTHTQIFSLSPMSKKVRQVNGLTFGIGHVPNRHVNNQRINGINCEANPAAIAGALGAFLAVCYLPDIIKANRKKDTLTDGEVSFKIKTMTSSPALQLNGLNISTGCFFTTANLNGINISLANKFKNLNGISIAPIGTIADRQNGLCVGIYNANNGLTGVAIGVYNQSYNLKGLHLGVFNNSWKSQGIQIGVLNVSKQRGFQLGIWNVNSKRSLPLINW